MDYFAYIVLPYVTIIVFVVGLFWRIRTWWAKPRAKAVLFPAERSDTMMVAKVAADILFFAKTFRMSKSLWAMAFVFHVGLLLVIVGHIRTVIEPGFLWSLFGLGKQGIEDFSFGMGMIAGGILLAGAVLLLARRLTPTMRFLSIFQDYFVLALLVTIIFCGIGMRLWVPLHAEDIQAYTRSVLTLQPAVEIHNPFFLWHVFLAEILIMYLPFSKLVHLVSKPLAESWTMR